MAGKNKTTIEITGYPKSWDGKIGSPIGEEAKVDYASNTGH